jgi:type IV pilus assembly protein PilC
MADYSYKAREPNGSIVEGIIDSPDEDTAIKILHNKGYVILSLIPLKKDLLQTDINMFFSRPNVKDVVVFTRQLATLIDADMPLAEGLRTLSRQIEKPSFRKVIVEISELVESGSSLSNALSQYPKLFSTFYIKLVQSGEVSGKLHDSLLYLADYLERSRDINSKIRSALAYPAFVVFTLVVVALIMVIYVLPKLLEIFKEAGVKDLPITTKILIWLTDFVNENLIFIIGSVLVLIYISWLYIRTQAGEEWFDNVKIKFPSIGKAIRNLYLARMAESLSTLIKSGVPILDSLKITAELVGNIVYRNIMLEAEESVRNGNLISSVLDKYEEVPPLFTSMVAIGEKTGKIDFMLEHMSKFYKSESENAINSISQLIEPILILILGAGVALLVSSILLPIYSMVQTN